MRILALVTDAYGGHGGIALYNRDLLQALADMPEVEHIDVVPRTMRFEPQEIPAKVSFHADTVGSKLRFISRGLRLALASSIRPDLIVCSHVHLLPLAVVLARMSRARIVLVVYGIDVWQIPYRTARHWVKRCNAIWSISDITRGKMNEWADLPAHRYTLLPNAIHLDRYEPGQRDAALLAKFGIPRDATVLLTVARLAGFERYKGIDETVAVLPAVLEHYPNARFVIVGDGNDRPRLEKLVHDSGLTQCVTFAGLVDEHEKLRWYQSADVFVMPGRGEGFGFVFLEALACGVPAVGSNADGSREALRCGELGEVTDPTDTASIRDGILRALQRPRGVPPGLFYFAWPKFSQRVREALTASVGDVAASTNANQARQTHRNTS